jgi:DNA-binding MarR family transcriptional regulator
VAAASFSFCSGLNSFKFERSGSEKCRCERFTSELVFAELFLRRTCQGWLAVTATQDNSAGRNSADRVDQACAAAANGRRAARALSEWTRRFGLTEAEFQLLWRLRLAPADGLNQTALAVALAFSAAQVSAVVEHLRQRALIGERGATGDRRRHHWQLTADGLVLLNQMLESAASLRYDGNLNNDLQEGASRRREAAA